MPIKQASAWGQFWADLSEQHSVHGCGITTPLQSNRQAWRKAYYSTWFKMVEHGGKREPVYYSVEGDTMSAMLLDGLAKTGALTMRMRMMVLACAIEALEHRVTRESMRRNGETVYA